MPRNDMPGGSAPRTFRCRKPWGISPSPQALSTVPRAPFHDDGLETGPGRVDRGGQTGRAAARHQEIDHRSPASAAFSTRMRVRSSAALSTVNTSAVIQAVCTSGSATPSTTTAT